MSVFFKFGYHTNYLALKDVYNIHLKKLYVMEEMVEYTVHIDEYTNRFDSHEHIWFQERVRDNCIVKTTKYSRIGRLGILIF